MKELRQAIVVRLFWTPSKNGVQGESKTLVTSDETHHFIHWAIIR